MSDFSKRERVLATIQGEEVDRTPVSAWGHLLPAEKNIDDLVSATIRFALEYDWDLIKVNPRATYFAEAWGNRYDFEDYSGVFPRLISGSFTNQNLDAIQSVNPTEGAFGSHLELLSKIKKGVQDIPFVQTVFTPLSVLGFIIARNQLHTQEAAISAQFEAVKQAIREQPQAVHIALKAITETLSKYAAETLNAGADGIFLAVTGLAREGVLTREEYEIFGKPYDLKVLDAVRESKLNIFHICGEKSYLDLLADFPVPAVSWAASGHGNPDLSQARSLLDKVLIGGVNEKTLLLKGQPEEVRHQAEQAIALGGKTKFILAPGCAVDPATPQENLLALRHSVQHR